MTLNPASQDVGAFRAMSLGFEVDRATGTLPATAYGALFNIVGGRVAIVGLVGEVTTAIQNQACNTKITATPTTGTAVDIAADLDVANKELGTLFGLTGLFSDAMIGANAGATVLPRNPVVLNVGTVGLTTAATNTGSVKWRIYYMPIDAGAYVTAA